MKEYFNNHYVVTSIALACFVPAGKGKPIHKNRPTHGLAFCLGGEIDFIFENGQVCTVGENDVIYLPKYSNYEVKRRVEGDIYSINFQRKEDAPTMPFTMHLLNGEEVLKCYQRAEKAWRRNLQTREYYVLSELYKIMYEMKRQYCSPYLPETRQSFIDPAIDYVHKHYMDEIIDMGKLSALCGISYDYLRKLFQKFYGCSPIKYVNALKLKRAKELLSQYSVSEAAYGSGFSDLSHFSRFFKKNVGVLPSEYRPNE